MSNLNIAQKRSLRLKKMILAALFVALAYVVRLVIPPINVMFLSFEFKDAVIAMGAMQLGPLWALAMSALVALLEFLTLSSTGLYGMIMNFAAAAAFTVSASLVYKMSRTMRGAALGVWSGAVSLVAVMLPLNLLITPYFMGVNVGVVGGLIPELLLPFNAAKGIMNAGIALLLYKPLMTALRQTRLVAKTNVTAPTSNDLDSKEEASQNETNPSALQHKRNTWLSVLLAVLFIAVGAVVLFVFLSGNFGEIEY